MEVKHKGCFYCGSKSQPILRSIVKVTIDADSVKNYGHTSGFALCDSCAKFATLDQRIPLAQRRAA